MTSSFKLRQFQNLFCFVIHSLAFPRIVRSPQKNTFFPYALFKKEGIVSKPHSRFFISWHWVKCSSINQSSYQSVWIIMNELNQVRFIFITYGYLNKTRGSSLRKKSEIEMVIGQATNDFWNSANSNFGMSMSYKAESQTTPGTPKTLQMREQPRSHCLSTGYFCCSLI